LRRDRVEPQLREFAGQRADCNHHRAADEHFERRHERTGQHVMVAARVHRSRGPRSRAKHQQQRRTDLDRAAVQTGKRGYAERSKRKTDPRCCGYPRA